MSTSQVKKHQESNMAYPRVTVSGVNGSNGSNAPNKVKSNGIGNNKPATKDSNEHLNISPKERLDYGPDGGELKRTLSSTSTYSHNDEFLIPEGYTIFFPWRKIGSFVDADSELSTEELKDLSIEDDSNKLTTYIYEKYYADLYWNCSLIICCCFASWVFSYYGFGFLSFIFVSIFTFASYRSEFRRFNTNIRDDMERIQSKENLEKSLESMDWLNNFLAKFWVIYMPALSDLVISNTNAVLSEVAPPPPIMKLSLDEFTLGTKAPKIDSIKSCTKLGNDIYQMDWKLNFSPNDISDMTQNELKHKIDPKIALGIKIGKGFVGASLPILVENMSFVGDLRIKIKLGDVFPHIDLISVCFLEPPKIDYALKPVGGNTLGIDVMSVIPGLSSFVTSLINSNLAPLMYYPNTIDVRPSDFLQAESATGCLLLRIRGIEYISRKMINPYVKFGKENDFANAYQTDIKANTVTPIFNETKRILITNLNSRLKFELFNLLSDGNSSSIGEAFFELQDLLQDPILELNDTKFIKNNKNVGKIIYDLKWFPVLKSETLPNGTKSNPPDSETGIINLNILSAFDLDVSKSLTGKLSTYIEVYLDNKLIETSRIFKGNNNPEFNFQIEHLVYNKSISILKIVVKDISSFSETIIGEFESRLLDLVLDDSAETGNKENEAIDNSQVKLFTDNKYQGGLKLSTVWKPLGALSENDNEDDVSFVPPIGIFKININNCSKLQNLDSLNTIDPYIRISSGGHVRGVTSTVKDSLNPEYDEEFFVSISSKNQQIRFDCIDFSKNRKNDRLIGDLIINLKKYFENGENQNKTMNFEKQLSRNGKLVGIISYTLTYYPLLPIFSHCECEQIKLKQDENKNNDESEDMDELEEQAKFLEDYKKHPDDYEWVDVNEDKEGLNALLNLNKDKVILSLNDLTKYNSGVLGINLIAGKLVEKSAFVQVFIDDHSYPDFTSRRSKHGALTSTSGSSFIRDLRHSILNFRIVKSANAVYKSDVLYESVDSYSVVELLKNGFDEPININLDGNELCFVFEFVPLLKDSNNIFETIEDTGLLKIDVLSGKNLLSADSNGYSDPFVIGYLNKNEVFKTQVVKKTLNPEINESFTIPIRSKNKQKLLLKVMDWDRVGSNDPLGDVLINLKELPSLNEVLQDYNLTTQGSMRLKFKFTPGYLKPNTSLLLSSEDSQFSGYGAVGTVGGLAMGAVGAAGGLATGAVGGLATGAVGAVGAAGGLATGAVGAAGGLATGTVGGIAGGLNKLKPPFIGHHHGINNKQKNAPENSSNNGDDLSLKTKQSFSFAKPPEISVNGDASGGSSPQHKRIASLTGSVRTSIDAVSVMSNSFSGASAIAGRLSILEFENSNGEVLNEAVNVQVHIKSSNGTEKTIYKTRKSKVDDEGFIKWHENLAFKCDSQTKMIFHFKSHKLLGKGEDLGECEILLNDVIGNKENIKIPITGKINGNLIVNFNYC